MRIGLTLHKITHMKKIRVFMHVSILLAIVSCGKNDIDTEKPTISAEISTAFPQNCDTIYFGENFNFRYLFSDNNELGSYSIDIHQNFDHHSHSTEFGVCSLEPKKEPKNPYLLMQNFDLPEGLSEYETNITILVPSSNGKGEFDTGDYHFSISLTDKEGWSTQKGLSIKMMYR